MSQVSSDEKVLNSIPRWLIQKQCNECLFVQRFTDNVERRYHLQPAIVEIEEQHDPKCSRYEFHGKKLKFVYDHHHQA